jgi:hypothetical protein
MRPALDPAGHRVPRTKPTCLLHTWRPPRRQPFALVLHLHQHQSSRNLRPHYLAKNQSTQRCQSLITPGSDHPPVLEPHMVLNLLIILKTQKNLHPHIRKVHKIFHPQLLLVLKNRKTCIPTSVLTVNSCIEFCLGLQADKSPVVVKGPFFSRVVNPRLKDRMATREGGSE